MIKINLLPAYVLEQEKVRKFATVSGVLVFVVIAGMLLWYKSLGSAHADLERRLAEVQIKEALVNQYRREEQQANQESQIVRTKVNFIKDLEEYNKKIPRLYEELARYTYKNILYRQITSSNTQITIEAYARSVGDAGKYLLNLYKASDLFSSVSISAVPGYPTSVATYVVGGAQEGAAGSLPYAQITGPLSQALAPAGSQQQWTETLPGFQMPRLRAPKQKRRPVGFAFTVTCVLKEPINPPIYGAAAVEGGAAGAPGAPGVGGAGPAGGPPTPSPEAGGFGRRAGGEEGM